MKLHRIKFTRLIFLYPCQVNIRDVAELTRDLTNSFDFTNTDNPLKALTVKIRAFTKPIRPDVRFKFRERVLITV